MDTYIQLQLKIAKEQNELQEILIAELAELNFESFDTEQESYLMAYCAKSLFLEEQVKALLQQYNISATDINLNSIEPENWNEKWESEFHPVIVSNQCLVYASFHKVNPSNFPYSILINPKMSFGTGHHQTTSLMIEQLLLENNIQGKSVCDMGCGTGVLAIMAVLKGAAGALAIDIDDWAVENAKENAELNKLNHKVEVIKGDASALPKGRLFDLFIANINRNIILNDLKTYEKHITEGGVLLLSGFYISDLNSIKIAASKLRLEYQNHLKKDDWVSARFIKY